MATASASQGLTRLVQFAAREKAGFHQSRHRIIGRIVDRPEQVLAPLTAHLARRFFSLRREWKALDYNANDWKNIDRLVNGTGSVDQNLLTLCVDYIISNAERVKRVRRVYDAVVTATLTGDLQSEATLSDLGSSDVQCLFVMMLNCALKSGDAEGLVNYVRRRENSSWVRSRFAYPIVYHAVNIPVDSYLDTYLSYMVPQADANGTERSVIRQLLRGDIDNDKSLAFVCYNGLMGHPYDALAAIEFVVENDLATGRSRSPSIDQQIIRLATALPDSRLAALLALQTRQLSDKCRVTVRKNLDSNTSLPLPERILKFVAQFVDTTSSLPDLAELPTPQWQALARMRWSRYPNVADFNDVTTYARTWRFLETGRLFDALMTSMYMLPRDIPWREMRCLGRLQMACGARTPYLYGAPRGTDWLSDLPEQTRNATADIVGKSLSARGAAGDRTWFHAAHWKLYPSVREGRVRQWLADVHSLFPVSPDYLTGIDWTWVDQMIPLVRIGPFRDTASGPYALLLRNIEEGQRDSTMLRTAIEPHAKDVHCRDFVEYLISTYGYAAAAFVRYFMRAENILLLRLAPNLTAALSERIAALDTCVKHFKFGDLLSEDIIRSEHRSLTSALMLLNVSTSQFDIPWDIFRKDVSERQRDNYSAYAAFKSGSIIVSYTSEQNFPYLHPFSNGRAAEYVLSTRDAPLAVLVLGIIEAFLDHPSYGMEAILSARFKHDIVRREYVRSLDELSDSFMSGVISHEQSHIINVATEGFLASLDAWLIRHLQTQRIGFEHGLFDFVPESGELTVLLADCDAAESFEGVIDTVIDWIGSRLEPQLDTARQKFPADMKAAAIDSINRGTAILQSEYQADEAILGRVVTAVGDTIHRTTSEVSEWFRTADPNLQRALTFDELTSAVEGRYERAVNDGTLRIKRRMGDRKSLPLGSDTLRLYFDLLSEVVWNAQKYGKRDVTRMSISAFVEGGAWGFVYSTLCGDVDSYQRVVDGHRYESLSDALFREKNSGLHKIAAMAASLAGTNVELKIVRRRKAFHLKVPLGCI